MRCRIVRLCLTGLLIAVSALAGYHWGSIIETGGGIDRFDYLIGGLTLVLLIMAIFFAMDAVSASLEDQALRDGGELERLSRRVKADDLTSRDMELALEELANDNARLRELLLARDRRDAASLAHPQLQQAGLDGNGTSPG